MQSTGLMMFWMVVVLVMIPVSLWLLKRSGLAAGVGAASSDAMLKTISQVQLGQGQKVVTIEVNAGGDRTWLVLGVTPQQITSLHTLPAPDKPLTAAPAPTPSFTEHLRRLSDRQPRI